MGIGCRRRYRLVRKGAVVVHGAKEGHQVVVGSIIVRCHIVLEYDRASYYIADWYLFQVVVVRESCKVHVVASGNANNSILAEIN